MLGAALSVVLYFLFIGLPLRVLSFALSLIRLRAIFTVLGFIFGLLGGLVGGYFIFFYKEPDAVEDPVVPKLRERENELSKEELSRFFMLLPTWISNPDVEQIGWLNKMLDLMWPFVDKAVAAQVREQAAPYIEQYKPKFMDSIEFEELTLGKLPPALVGIKSIETTDDEVIIELQFRWFGQPNIKVVARAFNLQASVQIIDVSLSAVARITLKPLVPVFPCFAKIVVSLMTEPEVDLGLKVLGMDPMSIPGIKAIVQAQVRNAVADMLLWPNSLEVFNEVPSKPIGYLTVRHIKARGLRNLGLIGKSDPLCDLHLTSFDHRRTSVVENELSPEWVEEFKFKVGDLKTQTLKLEVFDKDKDKFRSMGVATVSLEHLQPEEAYTVAWQRLFVRFSEEAAAKNEEKVAAETGDKSRIKPRPDLGSATLELVFSPFPESEEADADDLEVSFVFRPSVPVGGGVLKAILHSAEELEGDKPRDKFSPRILLSFRDIKFSTGVFKKSVGVDHMEEEGPFEWECAEPPVDDVLHVEVMNEFQTTFSKINILSGKEHKAGHCKIPLGDAVSNRRINNPYKLTDSEGELTIELLWIERLPSSHVQAAGAV